ncbi:sensor domain-containing diguanylate cyclase [Stratiformator vulcanicus]|uniref:diguanylate cyclase n=1 Tax=Stratiformator vulcanicus TaxID=2527980 RepID=A0A517QYN6_9PLAN|nr:sensor domain-containing diguanylate cyclase [Stratiformator vulcanicus]QDT36703.1 putative diguanylate cyclase YdaM [Stratiformator vulcanicus]
MTVSDSHYQDGSLLLFTGLASVLVIAAVLLGTQLGWTPGAATVCMLATPVAVAAANRPHRHALIAALIASVGVCVEAALSTAPDSGTPTWYLPLAGSVMLTGMAFFVGRARDQAVQEIVRVRSMNATYLEDLVEIERGIRTLQGPEIAAVEQFKDGPQSGRRDDDVVNYAMLLLSLQDVGRRVSTHVRLDTLIPTIITTTRATLRCRAASIYLYDESDRSLRNVFEPRYRDRHLYVPKVDSGAGKWVLDNRRPLTPEEAATDTELAKQLGNERLPDGIAPLSVGGTLLGLLIVEGCERNTPMFRKLLHIIASFAALALKNAQLFERIEESARHDPLTGILNRGAIEIALVDLVEQSRRTARPFGIILADIDHFKKFNDTYGHQAGDHVLIEVGRVWKEVAGPDCHVGRFGGEEFIALIPDSDTDQTEQLAEDLRLTIGDHVIRHETDILQVTASFGVTSFNPGNQPAGPAIRDLIGRSDRALYRAKDRGRNCVEVARELDSSKNRTSNEQEGRK